MYKHILVSTDGSELAQRGVDHGLNLAKALGAKVTIITVAEPWSLYVDAAGAAGVGWFPDEEQLARIDAGQKQGAEKILADAASIAGRLGVDVEAIFVAGKVPAEAIVETAASRDCSLIVMASHGRRGIGRLILGSQTAEVLTHSAVPVLVVR